MNQNRIVPFFLDDHVRDTFLILPGGAYERTSPREGKPVAKRINEQGMHAAIFEYRRGLFAYPDLLSDALKRVKEFQTDPRVGQLFLLGFSAGGHLALTLAEQSPAWFDGLVLAYPVVTGEKGICHERSLQNYFMSDVTDTERSLFSLESQVPDNCPPVFLFHTQDDDTVPVENSLRLIRALNAKQISVEAHLFPHGRHGLSLADASTAFLDEDPFAFAKENRHVASWFDLMLAWHRTISTTTSLKEEQ